MQGESDQQTAVAEISGSNSALPLSLFGLVSAWQLRGLSLLGPGFREQKMALNSMFLQ